MNKIFKTKKINILLFIMILLISFNLIATEKKISTKFNLIGKVFDYGQNIVSVELETSKFKVDSKTIDKDTFKVHAKSSLPIEVGENKAYGIYDLDREITSVEVNDKGNIVLNLKYGQNVDGSTTLSYVSGNVARNILLNLDYTVTQLKDYKLLSGKTVTTSSVYKQDKVLDVEADKFLGKKSTNGINYQFYKPEKIESNKKYPLIIWFHGNGEGGYKDYQNNVSHKLANRGVVEFGTKQTQDIFGGAYVFAPQANDTWYNNYSKGYIAKVKDTIDEVIKTNKNIDVNRIYVFGASAGGYMSIRIAIEYPTIFAGVAVSAPAIDIAPLRGGVETTKEDISKLNGIPFWFVHAKNDTSVNYEKSSIYVYDNIENKDNVNINIYDNVIVNGTEYNGHWSWIYTLNNIPINAKGEHVFNWMGKNSLIK